MGPGSRGACHRAALCADPLARPGRQYRFILPKLNPQPHPARVPPSEPEHSVRLQTSRIGSHSDPCREPLASRHPLTGPEVSMQFWDHGLRAAVSAGALDADRMSRLMEFLTARQAGSVPAVAGNSAAPAPRFDLAHLLWYAGALIVISAMGLFSTLAFSN